MRTEMRMISWAMNISLREDKTKEAVRQLAEDEDTRELLTDVLLLWYGHVNRGNETVWKQQQTCQSTRKEEGNQRKTGGPSEGQFVEDLKQTRTSGDVSYSWSQPHSNGTRRFQGQTWIFQLLHGELFPVSLHFHRRRILSAITPRSRSRRLGAGGSRSLLPQTPSHRPVLFRALVDKTSCQDCAGW